MNQRLLISFSLCLFLSSCTPSKKVFEESDLDKNQLIKSSRYAVQQSKNQCNDMQNSKVNSQEKSHSFLDDDIIKARLSDVPTLFDAKPVCSYKENNVYYIEYKTVLSHQEVSDFYKNEMEICGWTKQVCYQKNECFLLFKKAARSCFINVRPVKKNWQRSKEIRIILVISH